MFKKILIANRGEIALRVIRTAHEMGISCVSVYSEIDRNMPHVVEADEAVCLGAAPSSESYLLADKIIAEALRLGVQAIHPGYGFLAENAKFANDCTAAGIAFIGPPPAVINQMGSKTEARKTMIAAGVPVVPGTENAIDNIEEALLVAREVGFPIMVKAAAGGGGKGMRLIHNEEEFFSGVEAARREASGAFGDSEVYIEKYLEDPHHIEVQILADDFGNVIHIGERECSIQRRHQKVIEESPSTFISAELREEICQTAIKAAAAVAYRNAGTIEFLMDKYHNYYFLEMNTRLQVEHPVTEMVYGVDLVREQLNIAAGIEISFKQDKVQARGHAIECRICAEDPRENFLPHTGTVNLHRSPEGPGVRVDSGLRSGDEVSMYYDPMISKLVCWAPTRDAAISRTLRAIDEYRLHGIRSNLEFCRWVMECEAFIEGGYSTHFIADYFDVAMLEVKADDFIIAAETVELLTLENIHSGTNSTCHNGNGNGNGVEQKTPVQPENDAWRLQYRK
jgi:acetyl-CoA carboxylase, biotin carboxylase subunit